MIDRRAAFQKLMPVKATRHTTLHPAASSPSGVHMTSALHIVCPHSDSINRVPRTAARWWQARVLPSAAFRTAAGCTEQRRSLLAAAALVGFILVGLQWVSGRSARRREGDLKEQVP
jgi:hypothetical protein